MKINTFLVGFAGTYRAQLIEDNKMILDTGEKNNLIVDDFFSDASPNWQNIVIGTGVATTPSVSDTSLGNEIARSAKSINLFNGGSKVVIDGKNYWKASEVEDFTGISGDVSELGLKSGSRLYTRALIKDESGNPISIPVEPHQTLRITYSVYRHIPNILGSGSFIGPDGSTVSYTITPYNASSSRGVLAGDFYQKSFDNHMRVYFSNAARSIISHHSSSLSNGNRTRTDTYKLSVSLATSSDRGITSICGSENAGYNANVNDDICKIDFSPDLVIPGNHDIAITVEFNRGRLSDFPLV